MLDLKAIGEMLKYHRERLNMTQQDLADNLYVTRQAISKWETGKSIPSIEIMVELTSLFSITIDELLYRKHYLDEDFRHLLNHYPRNYIFNQFLQGNIDERLEDIFYLLSPDERSLMISHVIKGNILVDVNLLLPCLNTDERKRLIYAFRNQFKNYYSYMLNTNEKKLLEVRDEY